MFTGSLYSFQVDHEENLLKKCADCRELVLFAPTGSGKTVMVSKFIDDYLDENPNTVFLWLCPGAGGLEKQSQVSFCEMISGIPNGDVSSFINDSNPRGKVFFINWDKIDRIDNLVLQEGEHLNLMEKVLSCKLNGIDFFMLIDEEHMYQDVAERYINDIEPKHVLRISATPITPINEGDYIEIISEEEVIGAGLIASGISINEGLCDSDDDLSLLDKAIAKRVEIRDEYKKIGLDINPLVLIQFPNGSDEWKGNITRRLKERHIEAEKIASWFSGDHPENPDEIRKLNGKYDYLLFKQAIATGWDCPRAKILVKLREGGSERFNIQTIGRIRRMPERKHYDNSLLDNCYVYTLDDKFSKGLGLISASFYTSQYKIKKSIDNITLEKESLDGSDRYSVDPKAVVDVIRRRMLQDCDSNLDGILDAHELNEHGYVLGTVLEVRAFSGVARTTNDISSLNKVFGGKHEISLSDDGFIIRDAKRKIASSIGIDENISTSALRILFGPIDETTSILSKEEIEYEHQHKLVFDFGYKEFNAFLVNNKERIIDVLHDIDRNEISNIQQTDIVKSEWRIPNVQDYKQHNRIRSTKIFEKNVFDNYGSNIVCPPIRSQTEIDFEYWCENYGPVKWYYKNGDKGDEFFSLVYNREFRRSNFYPDYILKLQNDDIWIIEAKGGMAVDGSSNNIDEYAPRKFEALRRYGTEHPEIRWGFVRSVARRIFFSNTVWDERIENANVWIPIENIIQ